MLRNWSRNGKPMGICLRNWLSTHRADVSIVAIVLALKAEHCSILFVVHVVFRQYFTFLFLAQRIFLAISAFMT